MFNYFILAYYDANTHFKIGRFIFHAFINRNFIALRNIEKQDLKIKAVLKFQWLKLLASRALPRVG
jgi:hypothetical protein